MTRNGLITDWARFEESVRNRFGPSKVPVDPISDACLSVRCNPGTVAEYQSEFEKLMNRVKLVSKAYDPVAMRCIGIVSPEARLVGNQSGSFCLQHKADSNKRGNPVESESGIGRGNERGGSGESGRVAISLFLIHWWGMASRVSFSYGGRLDESDEATLSVSTTSGQPELDLLLARYEGPFLLPTSLPPNQLVDHRIHLLPNTKPVNVRPYRYPHYQKGEMEKLVSEMLSQGIIRFSYCPFFLWSVLVKD
ncbi:hypothetical protein Tco_0787514 [Tanacetum coccineum]